MSLSPARRNAAASYANFVVVAIAGLLLNPILLAGLGASAFGIWRASQRLLDFASVSDGRAAQALKWVVAHRGSQGSERDRRADVGATFIVWILWLPALLAISGLLVASLPAFIKGVPVVAIASVHWTGALLAANIVLFGLLSIPDAVLVGTNQGYRSMVATTAVFVGTNAAMAVAVLSGRGIITLAGIVLAGSFINGAVTWAQAGRHVSWWGIARPDRRTVKVMARFSGWVLVWSLTSKLMLSTDLIVISALVGAKAVADYSLTSYVIQFALAICLMTTSALMPQLGFQLGNRELRNARSTANDAKALTLFVATVAASGVLLFNRSFVEMWVGRQHFLGSAVNGLMVLGFVQLAIIRSDAQIQDTGLDIRRKVLIGGGATVASLLGGLLAYHFFGNLISLYLGIVVPRVVLTVRFPRLVSNLIPGVGLPRRKYAISAAILIGSYLVGLKLHLDNLLTFVPAVIVGALLVAVGAFYAIIPISARRRYLRRRDTVAIGVVDERD